MNPCKRQIEQLRALCAALEERCHIAETDADMLAEIAGHSWECRDYCVCGNTEAVTGHWKAVEARL